MRNLCILLVALFLGGCILPGDRLDRPVEIQGVKSDVFAQDKVTVAQIANPPGREALRTYASGEWPGIAPARIARVRMERGRFAADFPPNMRPVPVWILPPLPAENPSYVIRFESTAATFLLQQRGSAAKPVLYRVTEDGRRTAWRGSEIAISRGTSAASGYAQMEVWQVLFP